MESPRISPMNSPSLSNTQANRELGGQHAAAAERDAKSSIRNASKAAREYGSAAGDKIERGAHRASDATRSAAHNASTRAAGAFNWTMATAKSGINTGAQYAQTLKTRLDGTGRTEGLKVKTLLTGAAACLIGTIAGRATDISIRLPALLGSYLLTEITLTLAAGLTTAAILVLLYRLFVAPAHVANDNAPVAA